MFGKKQPITDPAFVAEQSRVRIDTAIADGERVMDRRTLARFLSDRAQSLLVRDSLVRPLF